MYCRNCGAQIDQDSVFCPSCGTPVGDKNQPVNHVMQEEQRPSPGREKTYYEEEFQKIAAGGHGKFNWAAFFGGPFHQLYHGSKEIFRKTFKRYLIAGVFLGTVQTVAIFVLMNTFLMEVAGIMMVASLINIFMVIWGIVLSIIYGKTCNKKLFQQVNGKAEHIPAKSKSVIVLVVLMALWSILMFAIIALGNRNIMAGEEEYDWDEPSVSNPYNIEEQNGLEIPEQEDSLSDVQISDLPQVAAEDVGLYTNLSVIYDVPDRFFGVSVLHGDVTVTMDELFSMLFPFYYWDSSVMDDYSAQGTMCDAVCEWSDIELRMRFFEAYGQVNISNAVIKKKDGSEQELSQQEIANLMAEMCRAYHEQTDTIQESPALSIQGLWYDRDEDSLMEITETTIGQAEYIVQKVTPISVTVFVPQQEGPFQNVEMTVVDDTMTMSFLEIAEGGNPYEIGQEVYRTQLERVE